MTNFYRICSTCLFLFLFVLSGCTSENAKYQPKPEDIPTADPATRDGETESFLPPGG